jgi:hypothetical protein
MIHPHPDELLLLASGELAEPRMGDVAAHVGTCPPCRDALTRLDESLTALGGASPRRSRLLTSPALWGGVAVAAAATLAVVFIRQPQEPAPSSARWKPLTTWSATAGYVAGGQALADIDAQLTRLEQEPHYARP